MNGANPKDGPREACKTYVEQTKLLVTLASAFVVAPAALIPLFRGSGAIEATHELVEAFFWAELLFVASVISGYIVLATIAGSQHGNNYNVYRPATRAFSLLQIGLYAAGLWQFIEFIQGVLQGS